MKKELEELEWKRLLDPDLLPYNLVEEMKKEEYSNEDLYEYFNSLCCVPKGSFIPNKKAQLWVLLKEKEKIIKGFCWVTLHLLFKEIKIEIFNILKELRVSGGALTKLVELINILKKETGMEKVIWESHSVEIAKKYGFRREKKVRLEYRDEGSVVKEVEC